MIDLHSHIIFDTDDGAKSIEKSINILKEAADAGFTSICCTPHYIEPQYTKNKAENKEKLEIIKEKLREENIDIKLYLGNEIYITDNMKELIDDGKVSTIADSKYVLVELPLTQKILNAEEMIEDLIFSGYIVILAHPERYIYAQKDLKYFDGFIERGVYLQGNYESIIGKYGIKAKKALKKLLKEQKIDLMSTDVHNEKSTYTKMHKVLKRLKHYAKNDYYDYITAECQEKILKDI
jgi:protein-tyrosine phosphatase